MPASTRLGANKQTPGTNTNIWGGKLNDEAIEIIDEAHGVETIALTGSRALTSTNFVSNEVRNAVLIFTAGVGLIAAPTVTVPSAEKTWHVDNRTGFPLTFSCGGTPVTVPIGRQARVICDGANLIIFDPVTTAMAGTVANAAAAAASATAAATSATQAGTAATNAGSAASTSAGHASAASGSATNAATSAAAALSSKTAAETAETNAEAAVSTAAISQMASAGSATAAGTSETNAADSAAAAATSETNAAASETAAAGHATAAAGSETAAGISEDNAAVSASAAAQSAQDAALFDPSSYYTKTEVDDLFDAFVIADLYPISLTTPAASATGVGAGGTYTFVGSDYASLYGWPQASRAVNIYLQSAPSIIVKTFTASGTGTTVPATFTGSGLATSTAYLAEMVYADSKGNTVTSAKVAFTTASAFKPAVGEAYEGGLLAAEAASLDGGTWDLIACLNAAITSGSVTWDTGSATTTGKTSVTNGPDNTTLGSQTRYAAAKVCLDLVTGGKSDWYLPARTELELMYASRNGFTGGEAWAVDAYWTSTEAASANAYRVNFTDGVTGTLGKGSAARIRAIRRVAI